MFHEELKGKIVYSVQLPQYSQHDVVKVGGDIVFIGKLPELKDFIGSEPHDNYHDVYHIVIDDGLDTLTISAIPETLLIENELKVGDLIIVEGAIMYYHDNHFPYIVAFNTKKLKAKRTPKHI